MQSRINLLLGLNLSKDQGSRKFAWKQGLVKEFLRNYQVLIMDVRRNYLITVLLAILLAVLIGIKYTR